MLYVIVNRDNVTESVYRFSGVAEAEKTFVKTVDKISGEDFSNNNINDIVSNGYYEKDGVSVNLFWG